MKTKTHFISLIVAVLGLAGAFSIFSGCGGGNDKNTIAFVTNGVDPFWDLCAAGVSMAEKEFGIGCEVHMPTKGVVDQKRIMESLVAKGIKGIAISPVDAENQKSFFNEIAQNTKLITHDSDAPTSNRIAFIGTNNYKAGRALGTMIKEVLPDGGNIMIFVGRMEQLNARQRRQGLIDELLDRKEQELNSLTLDPGDATNITTEDSNFTILDTRTDNFDKAMAKSNAENAIAKYKDSLDCMVGLFAYNPPACIDAIKEANKLGQIKVVGFDEQDTFLKAIQDGHAYGTISQQPWKYGYESVKMLKGILDGKMPESEFLVVPFLVVTKENVDEFWATKKKVLANLKK